MERWSKRYDWSSRAAASDRHLDVEERKQFERAELAVSQKWRQRAAELAEVRSLRQRLIPTLLQQKTGEPLLETVYLFERRTLAQILREPRVLLRAEMVAAASGQRNETAELCLDRMIAFQQTRKFGSLLGVV